MSWTLLGTIGKPHGLKGAFVLSGYAGEGSVFALSVPFIVGSPESASYSTHELIRALCLNGRWVLHLTDISSIERAEQLRGISVYCKSDDLESQYVEAEGEYLLSSLEGAEVFDFQSGTKIGTFLGVEDIGRGQNAAQRWWFRSGASDFAVPGHLRFIPKVDKEARQIWLDEWRELEELARSPRPS